MLLKLIAFLICVFVIQFCCVIVTVELSFRIIVIEIKCFKSMKGECINLALNNMFTLFFRLLIYEI